MGYENRAVLKPVQNDFFIPSGAGIFSVVELRNCSFSAISIDFRLHFSQLSLSFSQEIYFVLVPGLL